MRFGGVLLTFLVAVGVVNTAHASVVYRFKQEGFSSGGTVTGIFRGKDLNKDGRIFAQPNFADFSMPLGNELEYAKVTFTGFSGAPDPIVLEYDKSVADMTAFDNAFMAFAYNVDGGVLGDDADEGWSLAYFATPTSFNYQLGQAFRDNWAPVLPTPTFVPCGTASGPGFACAGLVEYVFDPTIQNVVPGFTDFSNAPHVAKVPIQASVWLLLGGLGVVTGMTRRRQHGR